MTAAVVWSRVGTPGGRVRGLGRVGGGGVPDVGDTGLGRDVARGGRIGVGGLGGVIRLVGVGVAVEVVFADDAVGVLGGAVSVEPLGGGGLFGGGRRTGDSGADGGPPAGPRTPRSVPCRTRAPTSPTSARGSFGTYCNAEDIDEVARGRGEGGKPPACSARARSCSL